MSNENSICDCPGKKASDYFFNGYHCAEAVVSAVLEARKEDPALAVAHATPFGGGMGKSFQEACGALSGALIAIGHVFGRSARGKDWNASAAMGLDLREHFLEMFGDTKCGVLRERFGECQMKECAGIVAEITRKTVQIIESEWK